MNKNYISIIAASPAERQGLFLTAANRLGTPLQNVEKNFWVCVVLDILFNGRHSGEPRLLFKGGTSLSKGYGLISRFSEDLDITVFREDIDHGMDAEDMEKLSGKQKRMHLDAIKKSCQAYVQEKLRERLHQQMQVLFAEVGVLFTDSPVIQDPDDPDSQTLLVHYPAVSADADDYIKPFIKIEAGAKSALDPHQFLSIQPYVSNDILESDLTIQNVVTISAERTFWDKVVILHGLRRWHDNRGQLRHQGHRISRHYYDVYKLMHSAAGENAKKDLALALDCARHAKMFFNSVDLDLTRAQPGSFSIMPSLNMIEALKQDYKAMTGMIFGEAPNFDEVVEAVLQLEKEINQISSFNEPTDQDLGKA